MSDLDENNNLTCKVRYLDTGHLDHNVEYGLDQLLVWKKDEEDFAELETKAPRAIECLLFRPSSQRDEQKQDNEENQPQPALNYEDKICQETKYLFKDQTARLPTKCVLVGQTKTKENKLLWIVKLYKPNEYKLLQKQLQQKAKEKEKYEEIAKGSEKVSKAKATPTTSKSLNELIVEYNEQEKLVVDQKDGQDSAAGRKAAAFNNFKSLDIRLASGQVDATTNVLKFGGDEKTESVEKKEDPTIKEEEEERGKNKVTTTH